MQVFVRALLFFFLLLLLLFFTLFVGVFQWALCDSNKQKNNHYL